MGSRIGNRKVCKIGDRRPTSSTEFKYYAIPFNSDRCNACIFIENGTDVFDITKKWRTLKMYGETQQLGSGMMYDFFTDSS